MFAPLLTTKLYLPPGRPNLAPRRRLVERLAAGLQGPLTLISAPAGYGKTTLMSEWRLTQGADYPLAWLALDREDNDPLRFLTYLTAALGALRPGLGKETLAALQAPQPPPPAALLTALINELAEIERPFALALDDYHVIEAQPVHEALRFLLEHMPHPMHLVILARADPPLPLSRLRALGLLTEIRIADLRFTPGEALQFLNQCMGLALSETDIAALERRTEGWIAGLQLAALSMQGRKDVQDFITAFTGSHHYVVDYLVEEVLDRQPPRLREFLIKTSVLESVCAALCEAVTGEDGGQAALERLEQANLFLFPLDDERRWYRYHPLFADVLRSRLRQVYPEQMETLHRRASQWYEQNGDPDRSIEHALSAHDWARAASLMDAASETAFRQDAVYKLARWAQALPAGAIYSAPRLCIFYAWAVVVTEGYAQAEKTLAAGEWSGFPENAELSAMRLRVHEAHGKEQILRLIDYGCRAFELWPGKNAASENLLQHGVAFTCWNMGEIQRATQAAAECLRLSEGGGSENGPSVILGLLARSQAAQGNLSQALDIYQRTLALPQSASSSLGRCQAMAGSARIYYERNDVELAAETARRGLEYSQKTHHADIQLICLRLLALIHLTQGQGAAARAQLDAAEEAAWKYNLSQIMFDSLAASRAQLALAQGDPAAARHWIEQIQGQIGANLYFAAITLERARLALAEGDRPLAAKLLAEQFSLAESNGIRYGQIEIRILQALAAEDEQQALGFLDEALAWGQAEGFVRVFADQGNGLIPLLQLAKRRRIAPGYVDQILAAFPSQAAATSRARLPEVLSQRELEVLRLIADGRQNKEIAERLVIAMGTVKRHTVNIFTKLDVGNRTQAVARAREMGLL